MYLEMAAVLVMVMVVPAVPSSALVDEEDRWW